MGNIFVGCKITSWYQSSVPASLMAVTNEIKAARHVKLNMEMDHKHTYTMCMRNIACKLTVGSMVTV